MHLFSQFKNFYSPGDTYNYHSWKNDDNEQLCVSDSEMWFGKELKRLWKRGKRIIRKSKKLLAQPKSTNISQEKFDSSDEGTVVNVKQSTQMPEPSSGNVFDVSSPTNSDINVARTKKVYPLLENDMTAML